MTTDLVIARHIALIAKRDHDKAKRDHKPSAALWRKLVLAKAHVAAMEGKRWKPEH